MVPGGTAGLDDYESRAGFARVQDSQVFVR